ncbi:piggyBac transposable element-derived protein 2-like [Anthonomus grandis grandis]|uniref:piggyBac transposable element-derived protein 2-like n=1 Tax=Anthonomus grandis grandis TaxID=2921223 RepID=UPI0021651AAF|nr:piggyBac transposable element-derived protein 2-like [Anthonomus grandis grandis]
MREVKDKGRSFETTSDEIKMFIGVSILMAIYGLPRIRLFWSREMSVPMISDNITRDRYFGLRCRLKLVEDDKISREQRSLDRFWKVMLYRVLKGCRQNKRTEAASIEEQMIPFHGKVIMRQFVRGKPKPVGIKNFVRTTPTGIPLDFYLYEGKGSSLESAFTPVPEKLDIGDRMVLKLTDTLSAGILVYTDRYFTSIPLIDALLSRKLTLTVTMMLNRLPKNATFLKNNDLKKSGRGSHDQLVRQDSNINLVKWFDSKPVHFASSSTGVEPLGTC